MSEIWFRAWATFNEIKPVNVDRFTDSMVWIDGRRHARLTEHQSYFPTWEEAHAYLLKRAANDLDSARRRLQIAQGRYGNVKGMKRPTESTAP